MIENKPFVSVYIWSRLKPSRFEGRLGIQDRYRDTNREALRALKAISSVIGKILIGKTNTNQDHDNFSFPD